MSLVGKPPKTFYLKIEVDWSRLADSLQNAKASFRQYGQRVRELDEQRHALAVWENEGGAL